MDLRLLGPKPTPAERAAVDAALGPPPSAWSGGERNLEQEGWTTLQGGREGRARRDLLLPALHAVQSRFGWIPEGALNYICRRLTVPPAEAYGVASFYHLFSLTPRTTAMAHVCDDLVCRVRGAEALCQQLRVELGPESHAATNPAGRWKRSPCLGLCERGPGVLVTRAGEAPQTLALGPVEDTGAVRTALESSSPSPEEGLDRLRRSVPQGGSPGLRLIGRIGQIDPESLEAYCASGGTLALKHALAVGPESVIREIVAAKLVGRGGAAFPTGRKWEAVAQAEARPHYLVGNADESEPGTFKDRLLMEGDPFAVIEGMIIAAFATGCQRGYLYLRGEYPLAARRMERAIAACRMVGLLGPKILNTGFSFDLEIRRGAGAYICGEETALFNSIEGKRGEPRNKPPYPAQAGLFGRPTVINNIETLVNVPLILREGGAAYAGIGTRESSGPKLFCLSGHVVLPGLYEVPFGRTLRELIDLAGGVPGGRPIQAVLLGGAAGSFVGPEMLDLPLTLEGTRSIGASLGSGVVLVLDGSVDMGDLLLRIASFFRDECCGQCVPCRVGTVRQEELLHRLRSGQSFGSREAELSLLREIGQVMRDASICGLGQTASSAIESALDFLDPFPDERRMT